MKMSDLFDWTHDGDFVNKTGRPVVVCVNNEPRVLGPGQRAPRDWDVDGVLHEDGSATKIHGIFGGPDGDWYTSEHGRSWVQSEWPNCADFFGYSDPGPAGGCVVGTTHIAMADGTYKAAHEVQFGDQVLASLKNGPAGGFPVVRRFKCRRHVLDVRIRASTGDIQVLCTPNHRFLIGRLWVPIGFAHFGQQVLVQTAQKGSFELGEIVKIRHMRNPRTVYNFLIFQAHNYIANGLIVHNRKIMGDFEVSEETRGLG